jgi:superfamily II DNA helicase RecQ
MELQFFHIPARAPGEFVEELNRFLRGHRVLMVQRELVREEGGAYWAVCVEYLPAAPAAGKGAAAPAKPKVDYREILSEADFAVFSRLRELRKRIAEQEAAPVYAVFTNEQMAAMVTGKVGSLAALQAIEGVGAARVEKYGAAFLTVLNEARPAGGPVERQMTSPGRNPVGVGGDNPASSPG